MGEVTSNRCRNIVGPLLIVLVALLAYANSFRVPFMFDDFTILVRNPDMRTVFPLIPYPRWLVDLSFKLNYAVHGYEVVGYHAVNVLFHTAAALLLYGIVRRTLSGPSLRAAFGKAAASLALAVAALWAVHPLQTESVAYTCQRYEALMGLCMLGTLYAFIRSVEARSPRSRRAWADIAIVVCALGMGTKEVILATPLIVLLYDALFVSGTWSGLWRERRTVHIALFSTIGILVMFEMVLIARAMDADAALAGGASPWLYLATQTEVILHYLRLSVVPRGLCLDYAWPVVAGWGEVWPSAVAVVALGLASLWGMLRRHAAGFVGVVFFLVLAPTSSILPVPDAAFEHRMYVPLACVITVVVVGAYRLLSGRLRPVVLGAVAGALVVLLAGLTFARNHDYRSELAMWHDVATKRPGNLRARIDYGVALAEEGATEAAAREFQDVLAQIPADLRARFEQGDVPAGRFATMSPRYHYFRTHANYGRLLARVPETREHAINHFVLALRAAPRHPVVEGYLRDALREDGIAEERVEAEMMRRILNLKEMTNDEVPKSE